jgi:hypothetical protein
LLSSDVSVPAEFERQSAVLIAVDELLPHHPHVLTALVSALVDRLQVIAVITGEEQRRDLLTILCDWGLPAHRVHAVRSTAFGPWLRRDRPLFVRRGGRLCAACAGGADEMLAGELGALLDVELCETPAAVGSGELLSNGHGLGLTTAARNREAAAAIKLQFGFRHLAVLPAVDRLDRMATFVAGDTLLLGLLDAGTNAAAANLLDRAADGLRGVDSAAGPLKVERVPLGPRGGGILRSPFDVVFANEAVVVPSYADVDGTLEDEVMDAYCRLLPGREVVAVDATSLATAGLTLRSVALSIPSPAQRPAAECRDRSPTAHLNRANAFVTSQGWYGPRRSVLQMDA